MADRRRACCAKVRLVGDEVHVTLHPLSQGLAGLVLGSQNWGSLCAGIDFTTEDRAGNKRINIRTIRRKSGAFLPASMS